MAQCVVTSNFKSIFTLSFPSKTTNCSYLPIVAPFVLKNRRKKMPALFVSKYYKTTSNIKPITSVRQIL